MCYTPLRNAISTLLPVKHVPPDYSVPDPGPGHLYPQCPKNLRSPEVIEREAANLGRRVGQLILQHAPTFQLSQSLEDLKSSSQTEEVVSELDDVCNSKLPNYPLIAQSCKYVDRFEKIVAVYCGFRVSMVSGLSAAL